MAASEIHIPLTPFDHCVPRAYYHGSLYLPLKTGVTPEQAFALLHDGLRRVFLRLPWLNGHVHLQNPDSPGWRPGQLELRYVPLANDEKLPQLKKKVLESDLDFSELRELGFPTDAFRDADIAPTPFYIDLAQENPPVDVFAGQVSFLPGGCVVTAAIHHVASDQTAFFLVLQHWAAQCAAIQVPGTPVPADFLPGSQDRGVLRTIWDREKPTASVDEIDPETWRLVGLQPTDVLRGSGSGNGNGNGNTNGNTNGHTSGKGKPPPLKAGVFYISPARLTALQDAIAKELGGSRGVSANLCVCALIWRCFLKARVSVRERHNNTSSDSKETSFFNMVYDGRVNYSSSLPQTYLGNLTFNVRPNLPLQALTAAASSSSSSSSSSPSAAGLATAVSALQKDTSQVDSTKLLNLFHLLDQLPSYDELSRLKRLRTPGIDGNNMSVSSLVNLPLDSVCFGNGPVFGNKGYPEAMRPLMGVSNSFTRICIILPRNRNGGVEFIANMYDDEMEVLTADDEFRRYALCLNWPE